METTNDTIEMKLIRTAELRVYKGLWNSLSIRKIPSTIVDNEKVLKTGFIVFMQIFTFSIFLEIYKNYENNKNDND